MKAKRIKLNLHFKVSYLRSNFALTQGYLISNNPAQENLETRVLRVNKVHYGLYENGECWIRGGVGGQYARIIY